MSAGIKVSDLLIAVIVRLQKLFCSAKFYHFGADISRPKNYQEIALKPEASLTISRGRSKTIFRTEWFLNSVEYVFWKVLRCACHNLMDRRNCWGPNKLWDETRSFYYWQPFLKSRNKCSCVCRCRNSGVPCSTGTIFNPEMCRQVLIIWKLFKC